jgi:hypothetical protein
MFACSGRDNAAATAYRSGEGGGSRLGRVGELFPRDASRAEPRMQFSPRSTPGTMRGRRITSCIVVGEALKWQDGRTRQGQADYTATRLIR